MTDESLQVESRIGSKVQKLEEIAKQAQTFETSINIEFDKSKPIPINVARVCTLIVVVAPKPRWKRPQSMPELYNSQGHWYRGFLSEGMLDMADLCKGGRPFTERGEIQYDSITVKSKGAALPSKELKKLALEAWCEAFEVPPPDYGELKAKDNARKSAVADLQNQLLQELRSGPDGVKNWNRRIGEQTGCSYKKANLAATDLSEVYIYGLDFQASNFNSATMTKARLLNCDLRKSTFREAHLELIELAAATQFMGCDFTGATLTHAKLNGNFTDCDFARAKLTHADLQGIGFAKCNFLDADLTGASFWLCDLRGADLSQANLDEVKFDRTSFDRGTKWPPGFEPPPDGLEFKGSGANPFVLREMQADAQSGPIDFETFVDHLSNNFDSDRIEKSLKMLKSEKFQLFSKVDEHSVVGVVKSQTDPDLVYSCRLKSDGQFSCCTQNLFACGGLRGALCKHLLVLLIGLARADELDPTKTYQWVIQSQAQNPELDKNAASETFLRYKGAEAGEVDWRPTETMPEDYYAY